VITLDTTQIRALLHGIKPNDWFPGNIFLAAEIAYEHIPALCDEIDALRKKVAELEAERKWRPIENAPKYQSVILATKNNKVGEAIFARSNDGQMEWWWINTHDPVEFMPTHWMPLPTPPIED